MLNNEMEILKNAKFGDMFETEHGRQVVYTGKPFKKSKDPEYLGFMFDKHMELNLYTMDGYGPYGFSVGSGSILEPSKSREDKIIAKVLLSHKERDMYVQQYLKCVKPIDDVKSGSGCKVGERYRFEYIHAHEDDEPYTDFRPYYTKLTDNEHYDKVYITDEELLNNFVEYADLLGNKK